MAKHTVKINEGKKVVYTGSNGTVAKSVFEEYKALMEEDETIGKVSLETDDKEVETAEPVVAGGGEETEKEETVAVSETKLARRMPLLENLRTVYKGGKLIVESEEGAEGAGEEGEEGAGEEGAEGAEGAAKITELKEIPEDELVDIIEDEEIPVEGEATAAKSDDELAAEMAAAETSGETEKVAEITEALKNRKTKKMNEETEIAAAEFVVMDDKALETALATAEKEKDPLKVEAIMEAKKIRAKLNEAVNPEDLKVGDRIKLMHKTDGEIQAEVKSVKDKRIYWSNAKGQMGSLSFDTAIKKVGKPGPKPKVANENKRKSQFGKK